MFARARVCACVRVRLCACMRTCAFSCVCGAQVGVRCVCARALVHMRSGFTGGGGGGGGLCVLIMREYACISMHECVYARTLVWV